MKMTKNEAFSVAGSIHANEPFNSNPLVTLGDYAIAGYLIDAGHEDSAENIALVRREGEDSDANIAIVRGLKK